METQKSEEQVVNKTKDGENMDENPTTEEKNTQENHENEMIVDEKVMALPEPQKVEALLKILEEERKASKLKDEKIQKLDEEIKKLTEQLQSKESSQTQSSNFVKEESPVPVILLFYNFYFYYFIFLMF